MRGLFVLSKTNHSSIIPWLELPSQASLLIELLYGGETSGRCLVSWGPFACLLAATSFHSTSTSHCFRFYQYIRRWVTGVIVEFIMPLYKRYRSELFTLSWNDVNITIFLGRNGIRTLFCLPRWCNAFAKRGKLSSLRLRILFICLRHLVSLNSSAKLIPSGASGTVWCHKL